MENPRILVWKVDSTYSTYYPVFITEQFVFVVISVKTPSKPFPFVPYVTKPFHEMNIFGNILFREDRSTRL